MAPDDDLAASLPQPPPPAPIRRAAAIGAAMRRFDGADEPAAAARGRTPGTEPWWTRLTRPQAGALVAAVLVALLSAPVAWMTFGQWSDPRANPAATANVTAVAESAAGSAADEVVQDAATEPPAASAALQPPAPAPVTTNARPVCGGVACTPSSEVQKRLDAPSAPAEIAPFASAPPPPPPPPPAAVAEAQRGAAPSGKAAAHAAAPRNEVRDQASAEDSEIVLTARKVRSSDAARRGDWNACTVNDPERALGRCRSLAKSGAKDEATVTDGLSHAWDGDMQSAIAAFDRVIEKAPRDASAYLNRGLAYQREGDLDRALGDLDKAVRYAPNSARAYYQRSQLLRQKGDVRRAKRDEQAAIELDPRYADIVP